MSDAPAAFLSFFQPGKANRDAALAYASVGIFVHPLIAHGKQPVTKHGWHDATTNPEQIKQWWPLNSQQNIGIALRPSCIVVIDVDPRNDGDKTLGILEEKHGELPTTYTVKTAGGGVHYYYRVSPDFYEHDSYPGKLGPGLDLLINRYVVAPPSELDGERQYMIGNGDLEVEFTTLPFWWLDAVITDNQVEREKRIWTPDHEQWRIAHGERNDTLTAIAGMLRRYWSNTTEIEKVLKIYAESRCEFADQRDYQEIMNGDIPTIARSIGVRPPSELRFSDYRLHLRRREGKPILDESALYGNIGDFVRRIEPITEAHPAALLGQALAVFGNQISARQHGEDSPGFIVEDSTHRTGLYALIVGDSAIAGKGDSWSRVRNLFRHVDPSWHIRTGIQTGEGLIDALADDMPTGDRTKYDDEWHEHLLKGGQTDRRFFLYEPEFGRVLHTATRQGSITKDVFRALWDEGETEKITASHTQKVTDATLSVVGHITRAELEHDFSETDLLNGFGNRFLWIYAERTKDLTGPRPLKKWELRGLSWPLQDALEYARTEAPSNYQFSNEAWDYWGMLSRKLTHPKGSDLMVELQSRGRPIVRRLAVIYAVSDSWPVIEIEHLQAAEAFWSYCVDTIDFLFSNHIGDRDANMLFRAFKEAPAGLTRTEITKGVFHGNNSSRRADRALGVLVANDMIAERKEKKTRKTVSVYFLKPEYF